MLYLHGAGHFHPENEITNQFLSDLDIGTSSDWILERTGIHSRRTVLSLDYISETRNQDVRAAAEASVYSNVEIGARAAEMAIARAGIDREDIGLVIAGGSVPANTTPAEACSVAAKLGIEAPAIDVRSACTSFASAIYLLSMMRPECLAAMDPGRASADQTSYILVVELESCTRAVDYNDRRSAVLWGDAAAAVVLSTKEPSRASVVYSSLRSDPRGHEKVVVPWAGHFNQEGATVQSFAIKKSVRELRALQERFGESLHFIGHQANLLMLENVCRRCDITEELHHSNVAMFGNTATAGAPSVLSAEWDTFKAGDHVAIVGVGAGLTWTSTVLRFEA